MAKISPRTPFPQKNKKQPQQKPTITPPQVLPPPNIEVLFKSILQNRRLIQIDMPDASIQIISVVKSCTKKKKKESFVCLFACLLCLFFFFFLTRNGIHGFSDMKIKWNKLEHIIPNYLPAQLWAHWLLSSWTGPFQQKFVAQDLAIIVNQWVPMNLKDSVHCIY